jgi:hypothetical protein
MKSEGRQNLNHSTIFKTNYILIQASILFLKVGARGSVVVEALSYKPEGHGIASRGGGFFLIYLILPASLRH